MASCLSISPSTASLVVSFTEPRRSLPCLPVAAISAASDIVSLKLTPIALDSSLDVSITSFLILDRSCADEPAISP